MLREPDDRRNERAEEAHEDNEVSVREFREPELLRKDASDEPSENEQHDDRAYGNVAGEIRLRFDGNDRRRGLLDARSGGRFGRRGIGRGRSFGGGFFGCGGRFCRGLFGCGGQFERGFFRGRGFLSRGRFRRGGFRSRRGFLGRGRVGRSVLRKRSARRGANGKGRNRRESQYDRS